MYIKGALGGCFGSDLIKNLSFYTLFIKRVSKTLEIYP